MSLKREIEIMEHALGWPKCYRNYFCAGPGHDAYETLEYLVSQGAMVRRDIEWTIDPVYQVTPSGRAAVAAYNKPLHVDRESDTATDES